MSVNAMETATLVVGLVVGVTGLVMVLLWLLWLLERWSDPK